MVMCKRMGVFITGFLFCIGLFFGAFTVDAAENVEYKWRFGMPWTRPNLQRSFEVFCNLVESYTDGRMVIKLYPDGLLGNHDEIFHGLRSGSIEIAQITPYVSVVPGGIVNFMPWSVTNYTEFAMAFGRPDGIMYEVLEKSLQRSGFSCFVFRLSWSLRDWK